MRTRSRNTSILFRERERNSQKIREKGESDCLWEGGNGGEEWMGWWFSLVVTEELFDSKVYI